ncbi:MAG: PrsW family intramembrane metalloprotease [Patescibacteria group bacterium]
MSALTILWFIFVALLPGLFWLWFYRRQDNPFDQEPLRLIFKTFLYGAAIALPAVALEFAADFFFSFSISQNFLVIVFGALFVIAPIEEFLKYWVVKKTIYHQPTFSEPLDGIIYCISAGLGFASFENLLVVFSEGESAILLRFATATLMHAIASGIVGYYLGRAKFLKNKGGKGSLITFGLVSAILLHGVYNIVVSANTPFTFGLLVILMIVMYFILSAEIKKTKLLKASKAVNKMQVRCE